MPLTQSSSDSPAAPRSSYAVAALFALVAAFVLTRFDLDRIPLRFSDEIGYMWTGLAELDFHIQFLYSFPIHSATYAVGSLLEADTIRLYQFNGILPFFLMIFGILVLARRSLGSTALGLLIVAPLITNNGLGISAWPHPNHTAVTIFILGVQWALTRNDGRHGVYAFFVALFFVLTFTRSEFALSLYAVLGFGGLLLVAETFSGPAPRKWGRLGTDLACVLAVLVLLSLVAGKPVLQDRSRSLAAFAQHYAYGLSLFELTDLDPWRQAFVVFEENFGDASGIGSAFFHNPGAVLAHLWRNFRVYLGLLGGLNIPSILIVVAIELSAITLSVRLVMKVIAAVRAHSPSDIDPITLYAFFGFAPSILLIILIHPRPNYYQMHLVLAGAFVLVALRDVDWVGKIMSRLHTPQLLALATLLLAGATPLEPQRDPVASTLRHARAVVRARTTGLPYKVADTVGVCSFFGRDCLSVGLVDKNRDLEATLADASIALVVLREEDVPFLPEPAREALRAFIATPETYGFSALPSEAEDLQLFARVDP